MVSPFNRSWTWNYALLLASVSSYKTSDYLGIINQNLNCNIHIYTNNICNKTNRAIGALKRQHLLYPLIPGLYCCRLHIGLWGITSSLRDTKARFPCEQKRALVCRLKSHFNNLNNHHDKSVVVVNNGYSSYIFELLFNN